MRGVYFCAKASIIDNTDLYLYDSVHEVRLAFFADVLKLGVVIVPGSKRKRKNVAVVQDLLLLLLLKLPHFVERVFQADLEEYVAINASKVISVLNFVDVIACGGCVHHRALFRSCAEVDITLGIAMTWSTYAVFYRIFAYEQK